SEHDVDFHPIVDFVEASHLRYALTFKPTVYVSHIRQFWSTARIETTKEGTKILATIDALPHVTTAPIPTVTPSDTPHLRQYTRRARIAQSSALPPVADEPASPLRDELTDLCTSLQRQQSDLVSKFEAQELEITMLKARVKLLEDREGGVEERSGDDAPIKGMRVIKVPTGSGFIPTTGPLATGVPTGSDVVPTAGLIFAIATVVTPNTRRKGKENMIESETLKKKKIQEHMYIQMARQLEGEMEREAQRINEQIARDAEIVRIQAEEELQIMIDGLDRSNEAIAKYLQEYHQFATELPIERRIKLISNLESVKKLKTSEEVNATEEVLEEKVKEMIQLIPVEEVYVEALQVKHLIVDWKVELKRLYEPDDKDQLWTHTHNIMHAPVEWKLYDSCGVHYVTFKDKEIFMLVEKDYSLRKGLVIVMISYKLQVENNSQMESDLILKIYKIANRPRQEDD
nr:hypothetical protein [Tanacetum cinerariifolium]